MYGKTSFKDLFESTNYTRSVRPLLNLARNNTKPLCPTQQALAILTTMYEAPPETHSVRQAHEPRYKEPL